MSRGGNYSIEEPLEVVHGKLHGLKRRMEPIDGLYLIFQLTHLSKMIWPTKIYLN